MNDHVLKSINTHTYEITLKQHNSFIFNYQNDIFRNLGIRNYRGRKNHPKFFSALECVILN